MTGTSRTIGIVGLGLIGGSLARDLVARGVDVVATTRSEATRADAADAGITVVGDVRAVVGEAELVVLAVPLPALSEHLAGVAAALPAGARSPTVTDVGSVKGPVTAAAASALADPSVFVPGHPMAGTEHQGWAAADPHLFEERRWALALDPPVALGRWAEAAALATAVGSEVVPVDVAGHDEAVALVSHLPYALAAAAASLLRSDEGTGLARALAAGSFADLTRVAGGHPTLGADMAVTNRRALGSQMEALSGTLQDLAQALGSGDAGADEEAVAAWFSAGREGREALEAARASPGVRHRATLDREGLLALGRRGGRVVGVAPAPPAAEELDVTTIDPGRPT
ncbi:MAG: prephenate dehydrogenase [Iamia sp.]